MEVARGGQRPQFYELPHPNFYSLKTFEKSLNSQTLIKRMTLTLLSHSVLNETRVEKGNKSYKPVCLLMDGPRRHQ